MRGQQGVLLQHHVSGDPHVYVMLMACCAQRSSEAYMQGIHQCKRPALHAERQDVCLLYKHAA